MTRNASGVAVRTAVRLTICAAALSLVTGCFVSPYGYGPANRYYAPMPNAYTPPAYRAPAPTPPAAYTPPPPPAAPAAPPATARGPVRNPSVAPKSKLVPGFDMGFMMDEGIGPGGNVTLTYRIDTFVGLRLSAGYFDISDSYSRRTVVPVIVRAVFSTPVKVSKDHRNYCGIGVGRFISDIVEEGYYYYPYPQTFEDHSEVTVYVLEWGREFLLSNARTARAQVGFYFGEGAGGVSFTCGVDFGK
jgi:hypothetical protein